MQQTRFFDKVVELIDADAIDFAMPMLVGKLYGAFGSADRWPETRDLYRRHPLASIMMEDPYINRCVTKPRGYAGDAALIDLIYDQTPPADVTERGKKIFSHGVRFQASEGVRQRRNHAEQFVGQAFEAGKSILCLACGHFREGEKLAGQNIEKIVLVDQDPLSLAVVRDRFGPTARCQEANVFNYLRGAIQRGESYDLVYTLGLTDYLDDRAMELLHRMVRSVLAPGGEFVIANFVPNHLAIGWMDAVMDWHLIYREPEDLAGFAERSGFNVQTWLDATGAIAWARMQAG